MPTISIDTAATLLGVSRRTLWRRAGDFGRGPDDARGRTTVTLDSVAAQPTCLPLQDDDRVVVERADAGDADAANELAMLLLAAGRSASALYWLDIAAGAGNADAMSHLATHYMPTDKPLGVSWLAKAASLGHVIARAQLAAIVRTP